MNFQEWTKGPARQIVKRAFSVDPVESSDWKELFRSVKAKVERFDKEDFGELKAFSTTEKLVIGSVLAMIGQYEKADEVNGGTFYSRLLHASGAMRASILAPLEGL